MTLLCRIPGCRLLHVTREESTALRIAAQARRDHARCPRCRTVSRSVHSRYHRRPSDLPTSGQEVHLILTIRRFYCHDRACARRTFAERLPRLLDRYAQRTRRLADAQVRTALALGATPTARLLPHLERRRQRRRARCGRAWSTCSPPTRCSKLQTRRLIISASPFGQPFGVGGEHHGARGGSARM